MEMNRYEKLGRAMVASILTFIFCFVFAATFMVFYRFYSELAPFDTLIVCIMVGTFFGLFGFILGYTSPKLLPWNM